MTLDPTPSGEIRKTRPCVVISPDEANRHLGTAIVAPMTTEGRGYPTRISVKLQRMAGQVVLDPIGTVDKVRLVKRLGTLDLDARTQVLDRLREMFAP